MNKKIKIIQTAKETEDRLNLVKELEVNDEVKPVGIIIKIDETNKFQVIEGFGGAFTEAAADSFYKMSEKNRETIIKAYFSPTEGLGYSICRTHINSCDFSLENYSYDEVEGDVELKHFDISRDKKQLIPLIQEAKEVEGSKFILFASPWSPPNWMKTNGEMNHGGKLKEEYKKSWAEYYVKYIKAYKDEGIDIWGISVQNEPMAVQTWDSCIYEHEEERDFVRDYLGPMLQEQGLKDIKVIVWDHNRDLVYDRAKVVLEDKECAKYVWGIGFHWYSGDQFENLDKIHNEFPDKKLLFTEGCQEGGLRLGSWEVGERYGYNMINDLNHWTVGWVDWNMILNEYGGPNHVGNYCDAPIIADTKNDKVYFQSSYYYIGHFSKFVKKGAVRIGCNLENNESLEATAFKNPDGMVAVIIMNNKSYDMDYTINFGSDCFSTKCLAHSIVTLLY